MHDACPASDEPSPGRPASRNALRRHCAEVDPRARFGVKEIDRRSPARTLRSALRQPMQPAERVGNPAPVGRRLGRSSLHICHHHQAVGEQPLIHGRDRHGHHQALAVEMLEEFGLPGEISIAPGAETADRQLAADAQAPYVVGNPATERRDAGGVLTPSRKRVPSHRRDPRSIGLPSSLSDFHVNQRGRARVATSR